MADPDHRLVDDPVHVRAILDTVGEGIITIDTDEVIRLMNAEAEKVWGLESGECIGQHVHVLMPERYRQPHSDAFLRYLGASAQSGPRPHVEVHGLRKDGSEFPLELRFASVVVNGERLFTAAARDITTRKQRLRDLDLTIDLLQERVKTVDLMTRIAGRFINLPVDQIGPAIEEALGELGELLEVDRGFAVIAPDLSRMDFVGDASFDPNEMISMAHEWCAEGVDSLFDEYGRMAFEVDVSDAGQRADQWFQQRLLAGEGIRIDSIDRLPPEIAVLGKRFRAWGVRSRIIVPIVSEGVSNGILGFDTTRMERPWDDAAEQLLHLAGPIVASAVLRKQSAEALQCANAQLEQKVEERTRELREKQAQLVQSEKLASLGQLVAGVAHEVNTPLGAINSNNDTVLRALARVDGLLDDEQLDGLNSIARVKKLLASAVTLGHVNEDAIGRITTLVRSLRSFARLDQAELDEVSLHEGIDSTLVLLQHELKGRVKVERDFGELPPVACFPNQINQVFMNVLNNAAQAIEGKGQITICTRPEPGGVLISVTDTGRGIEAADLGRIFDPGYTTKGVGVGTGLGLSIVHQIIERHEGRIEVESEPGAGTTVSLHLPRRPPVSQT